MDQEFSLDDESRIILEEFHRACLDKKTADKIKAVLLLAKGFTYSEIEEILLANERTLNRYKNIYKERGIDGIVENNYQGRQYKLGEEQIEELKKELNSRVYPTAESIAAYIWKTFRVKYTAKGMVQTLHRLGYSYKKASAVPGKANEEKQKAFVRAYNRRYKCLSDKEKVYFMDGCHPTFNNHIGYGWIQTGKQFAMKTQNGRKRINLLGAYDPKEAEAAVYDYETLNAETTIDFLKRLRKINGESRIHIICDNVPYQHAKTVKKAAKGLNIHLKYLPGYSPNLNLIERYWGYLKKKVLTNTQYDCFEDFKNAILTFSRNKSKILKEKLRKYIPEKFHLYKPAST
jgi:transposase